MGIIKRSLMPKVGADDDGQLNKLLPSPFLHSKKAMSLTHPPPKELIHRHSSGAVDEEGGVTGVKEALEGPVT
jgi:hypothetical protein